MAPYTHGVTCSRIDIMLLARDRAKVRYCYVKAMKMIDLKLLFYSVIKEHGYIIFDTVML